MGLLGLLELESSLDSLILSIAGIKFFFGVSLITLIAKLPALCIVEVGQNLNIVANQCHVLAMKPSSDACFQIDGEFVTT